MLEIIMWLIVLIIAYWVIIRIIDWNRQKQFRKNVDDMRLKHEVAKSYQQKEPEPNDETVYATDTEPEIIVPVNDKERSVKMMKELAQKKQGSTPFYKDDDKNNWE